MVDIDKIPRPLLSALVEIAREVNGAPATGRKRLEADGKMGRLLVAINGAPFMWKGLLTPDRPPYPLPGVDPYVTAALEEFGAGEPAPAPTPETTPARSAVVRCTDSQGNVAFVRWTQQRGWACVLGNGTPASMFYAGVVSNEEMTTVIALGRAKTAADVLRIVKFHAQRAKTVELEV